MEKAEDDILAICKTKIIKTFAMIEMDGQPFRVRIFEGGDQSKKSLVIWTGYIPALRIANIFDDLAKTYRFIIFEQGSWGINSSPSNCSGL